MKRYEKKRDEVSLVVTQFKRNMLILWYLPEVFTSTCKPDEDRILREARRNPNELANNPRRLVGSRR
jgi:hypothetical protein